MVFPSLDGTFCSITTMGMGWDKLVIVNVFFKRILQDGAAFVVKEVYVWGISSVA